MKTSVVGRNVVVMSQYTSFVFCTQYYCNWRSFCWCSRINRCKYSRITWKFEGKTFNWSDIMKHENSLHQWIGSFFFNLYKFSKIQQNMEKSVEKLSNFINLVQKITRFKKSVNFLNPKSWTLWNFQKIIKVICPEFYSNYA